MNTAPLNVLCIASYEKGFEFMRECKQQGCKVYLLTSKSLGSVAWPKESIEEIFYIPDINKEWQMQDVIYGVSYLCRTIQIDRIVALDDFDVERAASLREHLRIAGMGDTTARYFRDKLAMRMLAKEEGINVPDFIHILNHSKINEFCRRVPFPYVIKPRLQAGATGIKKVNNTDELWNVINGLGDQQSFYLVERFVPGIIYHVDSIIYNERIQFAIASEYALPPMEVSHQGRVFCTRIMKRDSTDANSLLEVNNSVLSAFGIKYGVSHSEFIKDENGVFYFLETSARVGGANIAELVEAATGINLWAEWAKIVIMGPKSNYFPPSDKGEYAGLIISLAKQELPDMSRFDAKEICWKLNKNHHAGLIVHSHSFERISELLSDYTNRFYNEFFASQPPREKPSA